LNPAAADRDRRGEEAAIRPGTPRLPAEAYWLISRPSRGRTEIFTVDYRSGETLPVFSHEEEARAFLPGAGEGWQATENRAGGLVSILYGPCAGAERVALDPQPDMIPEGILGLVSLSRECFVDLVLAGPWRPWEASRTG
jgi:hypothetical protein